MLNLQNQHLWNTSQLILRVYYILFFILSTKNGELQKERSEFESLRRKLQSQLTELEAESVKQRHELSTGEKYFVCTAKYNAVDKIFVTPCLFF